MRYTLTKKNSTKPERIFAEILKELKIPFRHRWIIGGREIDFVIKGFAIEIDGHPQDPNKNSELIRFGYTPIHINNKRLLQDRDIIKKEIINLWLI